MNTPTDPRAGLARRLLEVADIAEMTEDADRVHGNDPTAACVFVDMRPGDFDSLLRNAASLLSSHGGGGEAGITAKAVVAAESALIAKWNLHSPDAHRMAVDAIAAALPHLSPAGVACTCPKGANPMFNLIDKACPQHASPPKPRAEGMVLVPREPTPGMLHFVIGDTHEEGRSYYAAMLAAAPSEGSVEPEIGCDDHDHARYIPGCVKCASTLPKKSRTPPPASQSATPSDELPGLPESVGSVQVWKAKDLNTRHPRQERETVACYTADQMRTYGQLCRNGGRP